MTNSIFPLPIPPRMPQNERTREQVLPEPTYFPFLWYYVFFSFEAKPYFLTVWLALSFPLFVLSFHLTLSSLKGRVDVCQERIECWIQNPRGKGPTRKQSGSEREIKRGGIAARENGIYRASRPEKNRHLRRTYIENVRMRR